MKKSWSTNPGARISRSMMEYVSWRKSWSTHPGARISRSMYHEGNLGARILEHEFLGVCIMKEILEQGSMYHEGNPGARILENEFLGVLYVSWRKSWSTNPGGSMYHEGNPGARILGGVCIMKEILEHESWGAYVSWRNSWGTNFLRILCFLFFPKKTWSTVYVSWTENHQKPRENCFAHHSPGFPVSTFFLEKTVEEGKKHNLVWSTNVPGERISLENEFPCRTNFPGERISLENESLENSLGKIVVRNIMVRQPTWKIPICFYVLEKFWWENPPGKSQFVSMC